MKKILLLLAFTIGANAQATLIKLIAFLFEIKIVTR